MKHIVKKAILTISMVTLGMFSVVNQADAARIGGKKSSGMQRSSQQLDSSPMTNTKNTANPAAPASTQSAAGTTAAQKPSTASKWMGPLAGIAAGLGLAALFSHLGLGEGLSSILTMLLLAGLAFMVIKVMLNVFRSKKPQATGPYGFSGANAQNTPKPTPFSPLSVAGTTSNVNSEEFLRTAKSFFIRLQAANDKKDTDDLRRFLTPEMFAEVQLQISERGFSEQTTDILQLNASVLSIVKEGSHDIGSVRFTGQIKSSDEPTPEHFSEIWHFTKWSNHTDQWSLAGIQQD